MKLADRHIIYFLGIGGIGMSALARWFMHSGKKVYGYDKTNTPLTNALESEGAGIHYHDDGEKSIPEAVLAQKDRVLVIFTPAVPTDHQELEYLKNHDFTILKRSEVLGLITNDLHSVAVAGTHGKTTTSSMIAHILKTAKKPSLSIMGGILQGYESNLIMEGTTGPETIAVLEADEYDRSFLRLTPDIAVVTSADPDHLDIYGDHGAMKTSFLEFVNKIKPGGHAYVHQSLAGWLHSNVKQVATHTYGLGEGQNNAKNIQVADSEFTFDFQGEDGFATDIHLAIPGFHNVENATAAVSVCRKLGIDIKDIKNALATFKGVKRRFEYHIKTNDLVYIDDYAHHPTEIRAFIESVRKLYPGKRITAIFQPHLFSRTRDFVDGFASSLDLADEILLMNIYPARELPMEGVTSAIIYDRMKNRNKKIVENSSVLSEIAALKPEVLLTIGAGDIDRFVPQIEELLLMKR
ncbi:MAG: UDP-N-acetylmuramate--L-alanine ligase [Cyclobacteriaceae bacterium]|nr:UDP-N-acetylmuramate--L-alanine ligase [Cyclobacteriaceae bacterium]